jgi:CDP-paratose 2-epimerase
MRRVQPAGVREPIVGVVEWFRPGDYERVENVLAQARTLGLTAIRTNICWADWYTSEGDGWYAWLLPRLSQDLQILPCFVYTPPSLGIAPKFSSPPRTPKSYADFIDVVMTRFGDLFEWIELWNRPDRSTEWDLHMDPEWHTFTEMIGGAAYWIRERGKKSVLPGIFPTNDAWFELMAKRGVLRYIDAVGVHGFPSTSEYRWQSWEQVVADVRAQLLRAGVTPEIWITQGGFSTWRGDERAQVRAFVDGTNAPVERVYWQELFDQTPQTRSPDSANSDERDYHYGMLRADGSPKLLFRIWSEGGLPAVKAAARFVPRTASRNGEKRILITGGAGFIGTNLAARCLSEGHSVTILDDVSRPGVEQNASWLRAEYGERLHVDIADIRDAARVESAVAEAAQVFHLAAQVAVTTSLVDPRADYEINIGGTLNVLEAIRACDPPPQLVFTSTNKVYGALSDLALETNCTRYQPLDAALRTGIAEDRPLDFHSPYGCSKGAADQYVLDYARTFGIPAVVFRMSCIYGPHQQGTEDQGWVAHFIKQAIQGEEIEICGDGMQVRDLLFVDDLVDAFLLAQANMRTLSGHAFNIGGGLGNTSSLLELVNSFDGLQIGKPRFKLAPWRVGDQRYYVSDTRKIKAATGWAPKVSVREGIARLHRWLIENQAANPRLKNAGGSRAVLAH